MERGMEAGEEEGRRLEGCTVASFVMGHSLRVVHVNSDGETVRRMLRCDLAHCIKVLSAVLVAVRHMSTTDRRT
eukprot:2604387-Rhodomonas_salina.1